MTIADATKYTGDDIRPISSRTKRSYKKGLQRAQETDKGQLSSYFTKLGNKDFSLAKIAGASIAQQIALAWTGFNNAHENDNQEIPAASLSNLKKDEFADALLSFLPKQILQNILKKLGFSFSQYNSKLNKFLHNSKQSFLELKNSLSTEGNKKFEAYRTDIIRSIEEQSNYIESQWLDDSQLMKNWQLSS